jgi:hypothetical protein
MEVFGIRVGPRRLAFHLLLFPSLVLLRALLRLFSKRSPDISPGRILASFVAMLSITQYGDFHTNTDIC